MKYDNYILEIKTKACHLSRSDFVNRFNNSLYLSYSSFTFSGNIQQKYDCPEDGGSSLQIRPKLTDKTSIAYYRDLLEDSLYKPILLASDIEIYQRDAYIVVLIKGDDDVNPVRIDFYQDESRHGSYDISSLIGDHFEIEYQVNATHLTEININSKNAFKIDSQFARDFKNIINQEGVLAIAKHPEILNQFIENDNQIKKYLKSISREYIDENGKPYLSY